MNNSTDRMRAIRERLAKATPGPWYGDTAISGDGCVVMSEATGFRVAHFPETKNVTSSAADAAFCANAPADLEYLLKRCERLEAALVEFKTQHVADLDCPAEAGTFCGCDKDVDNARISRALRGGS